MPCFYEKLRVIVKNKQNISFHDFRVVKGEENTNVLFDVVIPFNEKNEKDKLLDSIINEFITEAKKVKNMTYRLIIDVDNSYVRKENSLKE